MAHFSGYMADEERYIAFEKLAKRIMCKEWAFDPLMWFNCFYHGLGKVTPVYVSWSLSEAGLHYSIKPCPIPTQGDWSKTNYEIKIRSHTIYFFKNGKIELLRPISASQSAYLAERGGNQLGYNQGPISK